MVESIVREEREFRKKLNKWDEEAREAKKTLCHTCIRRDYKRGILAPSWEPYSEGFTHLRDVDIRSTKDQSKVIGKMEEYECPKGHGLSKHTYFKKKVEKDED